MKLSEIIKYTNGKVVKNIDKDIEVSSFVTDSRIIKEGDFYVPLIGEKFDGHDFINNALRDGAVGCISSKEVEVPEGKVFILVEDTLKAFQDIAKGYRENYIKKPLVAITGSVGKTTTKDMIASVLSEHYNTLKTEGNLNNFIGVPKTLLRYTNEDILVLEMGMNHFKEMSILSNIARPDFAVLTNIGQAHIGNLGSRENILKAKMEIIEGMPDDGTIIINNDDLYLKTIKGSVEQKIVTYGIKNKSDYMAYDIVLTDERTSFKIKENNEVYTVTINLPGEHFVLNSLAAWAVGRVNNVPPEKIVEGLKNFEMSKLRMDIKEVNGYKIINDTYNAGPESMNAILDTLSKLSGGRKIAVLADMLELGEMSQKIHFEIGKHISDLNIDYVFTYGNEAKNIAKGLIDSGKDAKIFEDQEKLIEELKGFLQKDDVVLVKGSRAMQMDKVVEEISK